MGYVIVEIQKNGDEIATICNAYNDRKIADQMYYTALAAAAVSDVPIHSVTMLTETGLIEKTDHYERIEEKEQ